MKNSSLKNWLFSGALVALGFATLPYQSALAEKLVIQVYSVKVRKEPSLTGPSLGELSNKQEVTKVAEHGSYIKVRRAQLEGWIPKSAVIVAKKLKLKEANKVDLAKPEVMAAGKGLGDSSISADAGSAPSAEELKRVDELESTTKTKDGDIDKFQASGGLKPGRRSGGSK